jgi:hypothetical protein
MFSEQDQHALQCLLQECPSRITPSERNAIEAAIAEIARLNTKLNELTAEMPLDSLGNGATELRQEFEAGKQSTDD